MDNPKQEELEQLLYDVYAHGYAGAQHALDGLSVREALPKAQALINSEVTAVLDELTNDAVYGEYEKSDDDSYTGDVVPLSAINSIKARYK